METALKQHSAETSGAQTAAPKCHVPQTGELKNKNNNLCSI